MSRFEGKVAVVTGAGQGVGLACAKKFVAEGATVVGVGRTESKLVKAAEEIGEKYIPYTMDVGSEDDWKAFVEWLHEKFGEIDILVNNAAIIMQKDILTMTYDEFKSTVNTNLDSVFLGMKLGYEVIKKDNYSAIVNISSVGGLKAGPDTGNDAGYNAAKAGVRNLTKHASFVFAKDKIRVNSVHPGAIATQMLVDYLAAYPEIEKTMAVNSPLPPHYSTADEVAECVLFLCDPASKPVTGSELVCDCGMMAI
ncbi:MAG: SDR family oxidoreductase [Lachnospiraceae bacterium]|nr:SDR family oxidoreductase [Lachnospiraceae bacterium]